MQKIKPNWRVDNMAVTDSEIATLKEQLITARHDLAELKLWRDRTDHTLHEMQILNDRQANKIDQIHGMLHAMAEEKKAEKKEAELEKKEAEKTAKKNTVDWVRWIPNAIGGIGGLITLAGGIYLAFKK